MRKLWYWKLKQREIKLGERTVLLGVLNVTPDSFTDGGKNADPDRAYGVSRRASFVGFALRQSSTSGGNPTGYLFSLCAAQCACPSS